MRYCKRCTMPDTRPGITFDEEGVCSACRHYEQRKEINWEELFQVEKTAIFRYGC